MAYLGNQPSNNFVSLKRQVITGNGGSSYTLDHAVASVNDVAIFVNNVRQDPASYSISGTALTLGGTISSSDSCYVIFLGQALQTVVPDTNTITTSMIQDSAITSSKLSSGKILQVVSVTDDTEVTVNNQTYTDTGLTANITPSSTSSKILIMVTHQVLLSASASAFYGGIKLLRGSTDIFDPMPTNSTGPFGIGHSTGSGSIYTYFPMQFLDSPSSTSQQTYKTQCRNYTTSGSAYIMINDNAANNNGKSVMTLMEVSG